jgi:hypothetical protein
MSDEAKTAVEAKPLFIPLKSEFYAAFADGSKTTEYRKYGDRWNERTCVVGRRVTLSKGYGRQNRLYGVVAGFSVDRTICQSAAWKACYGAAECEAACIMIELDNGVE